MFATSNQIKSVLKVEFPNTKFSVTNPRGYGTQVSWTDGPSEIVVKYILKHINAFTNDFSFYDKKVKGFDNPETFFDAINAQFQTVDLGNGFTAKQKISVSNNWYSIGYVVSENGTEVRWTEDLEAAHDYAAHVLEYRAHEARKAEILKGIDIQKEIIPLSVEEVEIRGTADFPKLNKRESIEEYAKQTSVYAENILVKQVITLSNDDFKLFSYQLMNSRNWLTVGGSESNDERLEGYTIEQIMSNERLTAIYRQTYYLLTALVQDQKGNRFVVDTQGYSYARYIGLNIALEQPVSFKSDLGIVLHSSEQYEQFKSILAA